MSFTGHGDDGFLRSVAIKVDATMPPFKIASGNPFVRPNQAEREISNTHVIDFIANLMP